MARLNEPRRLMVANMLCILALGLLIKIHRAMHHAMIGDGQRGEVQLHRSVDQLVQTAGAIEHRKLAVDMQVYKLVLGHGST